MKAATLHDATQLYWLLELQISLEQQIADIDAEIADLKADNKEAE